MDRKCEPAVGSLQKNGNYTSKWWHKRTVTIWTELLSEMVIYISRLDSLVPSNTLTSEPDERSQSKMKSFAVAAKTVDVRTCKEKQAHMLH